MPEGRVTWNTHTKSASDRKYKILQVIGYLWCVCTCVHVIVHACVCMRVHKCVQSVVNAYMYVCMHMSICRYVCVRM